MQVNVKVLVCFSPVAIIMLMGSYDNNVCIFVNWHNDDVSTARIDLPLVDG